MAYRGMTVFEHNGDDYRINDLNTANEFSASKDYLKGDMAYYQGELFRFNTNHSAGAWNSNHVTLIKLGRDCADNWLAQNPKRVTDPMVGRYYNQPLTFEQGSVNDDGKYIDSSTRIRSKPVFIGDSHRISVTLASGYKYEAEYFDENMAFLSASGFQTDTEQAIADTCKYLVILLAKSDNASITPSDASNISIVAHRYTHPVFTAAKANDKLFRETGIVQDLEFNKVLSASGVRLSRRATTDYIEIDGDFEVYADNGIPSLAFMATIYDEKFTDLGDIGNSHKEYNGWLGVKLSNHPTMKYVKVWCFNRTSEATDLTDSDITYANAHIKLVHGHLIKEPEDVKTTDFLVGLCPEGAEYAKMNTTGRCTSNCFYKNKDLLITNAAGKSIGIQGHLAFYDANFTYLGDSDVFENYIHPSDSAYSASAPYYKIVMGESYSGDIDASVIEAFVSWMTVGQNLMHKFTINSSTGVAYYVNASRMCSIDYIWVEDAYIKNIYSSLDLGIAIYDANKTLVNAYDWFTYSSDYGRTDRAIRVQHSYVRFYFCKAGNRTGDFSKAEFQNYSKKFMNGELVEITDSVGVHAMGEEIRNGYPYYYNGEMKATVNTLCGKDGYGSLKFAMITDLHDNDHTHLNETTYKQVMAIRDLVKKNGLQFVICGGDLTDGGYGTKSELLDKMTEQTKMFKEVGVPVLFMRGNHDDNSYAGYEVTKVVSREEFYARCLAPFGGKVIPSGKCYYYQDFDEVDTRVICLDFIDYPWVVNNGSIVYGAGGSNVWRGYSDDQIVWLLGTALNCNKRIIVAGHYSTHANLMTTYEKNNDHNYTVVTQALAAYNSRGSVTFNGTTYSFAGKTGKVLVQVSGHSHAFGAFKDNGVVWSTTGSPSPEVTHRVYDDTQYETMGTRTYGDITEAHFNVFCCDDSNVHIISFGQMGDLDFEV